MRYYPVLLDIRKRDCLVVGGGAVGTRKVAMLINCGARVTVVSPEASPSLQQMAQQQQVQWKKRSYRSQDLAGVFLVIGATDDQALNRRIHRDAEQHNTLCNIADRPEVCNFILPSIVNRGDLILAISTSGQSPAFAKRLRQSLEAEFGEEYARFLDLMGAIRQRLLRQSHAPEAHKPLFEALIDRGLIDLIKTDDTQAIDALLAEILGEGFQYNSLMTTGAPPPSP
jgi:precorrin-2 dehydrogenase/sirohydrochlorin ferrochelatase